jgi:hypothetical protein
MRKNSDDPGVEKQELLTNLLRVVEKVKRHFAVARIRFGLFEKSLVQHNSQRLKQCRLLRSGLRKLMQVNR